MNDSTHSNTSIAQAVDGQVRKYLTSVKNEDITSLYDMVLEQIEIPLYKAVIEHCGYNQSKATDMLGVSRGTFRKKLKKYFGTKYFKLHEQ